MLILTYEEMCCFYIANFKIYELFNILLLGNDNRLLNILRVQNDLHMLLRFYITVRFLFIVRVIGNNCNYFENED